jgi:Rrf2 family protein
MGQILRISEAASIAMHALILLAEKKDEPISNSRIAEAFAISANHSSKVMQRLLKSGYVTAVRGPGGGYTLAVDPSSVTLLDVYITVDGKPSTAGCLFGKGKHCSLPDCLFGGLTREADELIEKHLGSVTLADYMDRNISLV